MKTKTAKLCGLLKTAYQLLKSQSFLETAVSKKYKRITKEGLAVITSEIRFTRLSSYTHLFKIEIKTTERLDENDTSILRHSSQEWFCTYSISLRQLIEIGGYRRITFFPEEGKIYVDTEEFVS